MLKKQSNTTCSCYHVIFTWHLPESQSNFWHTRGPDYLFFLFLYPKWEKGAFHINLAKEEISYLSLTKDQDCKFHLLCQILETKADGSRDNRLSAQLGYRVLISYEPEMCQQSQRLPPGHLLKSKIFF